LMLYNYLIRLTLPVTINYNVVRNCHKIWHFFSINAPQNFTFVPATYVVPKSLLWHCWLTIRKDIYLACEKRVVCATCRQMSLYETSEERTRHEEPVNPESRGW